MRKNQNKGKFIVFEGIDGSGKTTQIKKISKHLNSYSYKVYQSVEPTKGVVGKLIRQILSKKTNVDQKTIALLFAADRTNHLFNKTNGIKSKIDNGEIVLCDRYYFSSYAYHAQYMDMKWVVDINLQSSDNLRPDLTIFLDVKPDTCLKRIKNNRNKFDIYEKLDIMKKVRQNYFKAFDMLKNIENIVVIDGNKSPEKLEIDILEQVKNICF